MAQGSFSAYILERSHNALKTLYDKAIISNWVDLIDSSVDQLKLIYCWLNDENRLEKLYEKDPSLVQKTKRIRAKSSGIQSSSRLTLNVKIENEKPQFVYDIESFNIDEGVTATEILERLRVQLKRDKISLNRFAVNVLNSDSESFKKLDRSCLNKKWNDLESSLKTKLKLMLKWVNDENRMEKIVKDAVPVYDTSEMNIEGEKSPIELVLALIDDLNMRSVPPETFSLHILQSNRNALQLLHEVALVSDSWSVLNDVQIEQFKVICCWLNDENRMEKLNAKDPSFVERRERRKNSKSSNNNSFEEKGSAKKMKLNETMNSKEEACFFQSENNLEGNFTAGSNSM